MLQVILFSLVVFSLLLFIISYRFKRENVAGELEELRMKQAVEIYQVKKRLKAIEEEFLVEMKK